METTKQFPEDSTECSP